MSGGHFDYNQHVISDIADGIEELINSPEYGDYPDAVKLEFKKGLTHLRLGFVYAQRIDWLVSGDDSEASFFARLKGSLEEVTGT
ncbi:MAG: hypothetical protein KAG66_00585 [Methylococcales bacterium]|nr:hypothetical protein [Methylococcales bacterium]